MRKGNYSRACWCARCLRCWGRKEGLLRVGGRTWGIGTCRRKETQVFSCAPVLVKDPEDAVLAVCRVCNSVAAAGHRQRGAGVADAAGGDGRKGFKGADAGG